MKVWVITARLRGAYHCPQPPTGAETMCGRAIVVEGPWKSGRFVEIETARDRGMTACKACLAEVAERRMVAP